MTQLVSHKNFEEFIDKENKLIFLQPYQIIKLQDLDNTKNNFNFGKISFEY